MLEDVYAGYRGSAVLRGVSGRFEGPVLLLGPNGSGKTTLLRSIAGVADVYRGRVLVEGVDASRAVGAAGLLAVNLPEVYRLLPIDAYSLLELYMEVLGGDMDYAVSLLEKLGLNRGLLRRRRLWELSAGQAKMVTTVAALASRARNILLDEPFEQLDPARKVRLLEHIAGQEGTMLVATHETWVLERLTSWNAYLVFEGRLWGPVRADRLVEASVVVGEAPDAILVVETGAGKLSIVPGGGVPITNLVSLDRIYEVLIYGKGGGA